MKMAAALGYDLSEEDGAKVYEAFCRIAAKKQTWARRSSTPSSPPRRAAGAADVPARKLRHQHRQHHQRFGADEAHEKRPDALGREPGRRPVDAAFLAIESILGRHYELDDFQIQAVTEGREAMGESVVKLRSGGKLYSGRGISTDIIGASVHAYLNAINKIVYEEAANA